MATITTKVTISGDEDKKKKILSKVGQIRLNAIMKVAPKAIEKAESIVRDAVDDYYTDYDPVVYQRKESLYSVM